MKSFKVKINLKDCIIHEKDDETIEKNINYYHNCIFIKTIKLTILKYVKIMLVLPSSKLNSYSMRTISHNCNNTI